MPPFWSPSGYYVVTRENIGGDGWIVRVLDFATWRHKVFKYPDEARAVAAARL